MRSSDRMLWALVVGSVAVATLAVVLVLRQGQPQYMAETGPEAVAYNYVLAMIRKDYERALRYLSPTLAARPRSAEELAREVFRHEVWAPEAQDALPERAIARAASADQATVEVTLRHFSTASLYRNDDWQTVEQFLLRREQGSWRLVDGRGLWNDCWREPSLEHCRDRRLPATVRPAP